MLATVLISLAVCAQAEMPEDSAVLIEPLEAVAPAPRLALDAPFFRSTFSASDDTIAAAWQSAVQYMEAAAASGFTAELTAPSGPFWDDMAIEGRAYLWHTGDTSVLRAAVERVFHPSPIDQGEGALRPLASYSLRWPYALHVYYLHTGETGYTRTLTEFALPELMTYFNAARNADGLLDGSKLREWPDALRTGFPEEALDAPNAVLNAFYYHSLTYMKVLAAELGMPSARLAEAAAQVHRQFNATFWDDVVGLYRDAPGLATYSVLTNALALGFGLAPEDRHENILALIRNEGITCADGFRPHVIEACLRAGDVQLAQDILAAGADTAADVSMLYLYPEYIAGLGPAGFGWNGVQAAPHPPSGVDALSLSVPLPQGRASMHYDRLTGTRLILPPDVGVWVEAGLGERVMVKNDLSHARTEMTAAQLELLQSKGWADRVGDEAAVWVSASEQVLRVVQGSTLLYQARCATATNGLGSEMNSLKTPLGWHKVVRKLGDGAVRGQVFRSREATREVWQPGEQPSEDLVLTRVLLLDGLEPGLNKGGNVDSFARNIYIHGTNDEPRLGIPSSHGCVRLSNDDVVEVFNLLPEGTIVLITEE